jgi:hypothetical protein
MVIMGYKACGLCKIDRIVEAISPNSVLHALGLQCLSVKRFNVGFWAFSSRCAHGSSPRAGARMHEGQALGVGQEDGGGEEGPRSVVSETG